MRVFLIALLVLSGLFGAPSAANAGSHLWEVSEVFSNFDGTIQFVELHNPTAAQNEVVLSGKYVKSVTNQYNFPGNLPGGTTAFKSLLLATQGFANLPGAPTPDHIIADNFFDLNADNVEYYTYDDFVFPMPVLPLDGINSLQKDFATGMVSAGPNTPTNYQDETGTVDAGGPVLQQFERGDVNQDGSVGIADAISLLGYLFSGESTECLLALDTNDDESANIADAIGLLAYLFSGGPSPAPPFMTCGDDPTPTAALGCVSFTPCP